MVVVCTLSSGFAALLAGREERAFVAGLLLRFFPIVVQITLNIPGIPKILPNAAEALLFAEEALSERIASRAAARITNGAGLCVLLIPVSGDALAVKKICVEIEEKSAWGRLVDADVLTSGGGVSRSSLRLPPRRCLICDNDAKVCARRGAHTTAELRTAAQILAARIKP